MSTGLEKYCLDTNCFIEPWNSFYSYKSHKSYWEDFVLPEITAGRLIVLDEVYQELSRKGDDLFKWLKGHKIKDSGVVIETDVDLALQVQDLLEKYPRLVDSRRGRSAADPFLVEYAKGNAVPLITLEMPSGNLDKPKIPDVCKAESAECISFYEYIDRVGISFKVEQSKKKGR